MMARLVLNKGDHVKLRFMDWIWHIRGNLTLTSGQSSEEIFGKLAPLFRQVGTSQERTSDTLTFSKKDPAAQDKMSIFDRGVLKIENGTTAPVLRYHLTSRALLFCFLAPLLFLSFAGLTIIAGQFSKPAAEEAKTKDDAKDKVLPQHWIDKAMGAPAPEKPKKDKASKEDNKKPKPTAAYVFAGLFAALYVVGRLLEARLVKSLFRKSLLGS
jgi:hypothetical protein